MIVAGHILAAQINSDLFLFSSNEIVSGSWSLGAKKLIQIASAGLSKENGEELNTRTMKGLMIRKESIQ
jgi:hypothetical protein